MLQLRSQKKPIPLSLIMDLVNYELRPYCQSRGADLWIEDLKTDGIVLGFRSPPGRRPEMRTWLEQVVEQLARGQPDYVRVLDLTTYAGSRRDV